MQYIALIYTDEAQQADMGEAERGAEFAGYMAFNAHAKAEGAFLAGEALEPVATAHTVRIRDGERLVTEGPFAETREVLGGFYLLDCEDLDQAVDLASRIPAAKHGCIEVRPIMLIPGDG